MQIRERKRLHPDNRIGIVNRGEAAVRFIRGVKEFNALYRTGFTTVAFYMEKEREAIFVQEADSSYPFTALPGPTPKVPYSDREFMSGALQFAGCRAVWGGWGFLAEDAAFVAMLENAGLVFIGPSSQAMALSGDKIAAKDLARRTGVPVLPWSEGFLEDLDHAREMAERIGYPVMIKAAHAGGGRGIRMVKSEAELSSKYRSARDETVQVTGGDILYMERAVTRARHLEVQVIADHYGAVHTFGVRDCSVQRRHQKILEETPPPGLGESEIRAIEETAARLIGAAGYAGAGTVEFLYDLEGSGLFFMEVNTRLQVEHCISEQLYNIDLVKAQIAVAMGKPLGQRNSAAPGVAIEVRLNAEDAERDFAPAPGKITRYRPPAGPGIRVDSGVEEGSLIPLEFDSMIAKIIAYAPTREESLARLERALKETRITVEGGTTNLAFLLALLDSDCLRRGGVSTHFVEELLCRRDRLIRRDDWDIALIASAVEGYVRQYLKELQYFEDQALRTGHPREIPSSLGCEIAFSLEGNRYPFLVTALGNDFFHLEIHGRIVDVQYFCHGRESALLHGGRRFGIQVVSRENFLQCEVDGIPYPLELEASGVVRAPSPAVVMSIAVVPGQAVQRGDLLLTLEAMKMEIAVTAPQSGSITEISVTRGRQVSGGQPLLQMDTPKAGENRPSLPVSFERWGISDKAGIWTIAVRDFLAVFLGYDHPRNCNLLEKLLVFGREHPEFLPSLLDTLWQTLEIYASAETLFSREHIDSEEFGSISYQELLVHFLRRRIDREKGFPKKFLNALDRACRFYPLEGLTKDEAYLGALFRIYISHVNLAAKQELVRSALFALDDILPKREGRLSPRFAPLLDELAHLTRKTALADIAVYARYHFFDRVYLAQFIEERRAGVENLLETIGGGNADEAERAVAEIVDSGHYIVSQLIDRASAAEGLALTLLGKRFTRDRQFVSSEIIAGEVAFAHIKSETSDSAFDTVVAVLTEERCAGLKAIKAYLALCQTAPEVLLFFPAPLDRQEWLFQCVQNAGLTCNRCCVGIFAPNGAFTYRSFTGDGSHHPFNPLFFRETRADRLVNFSLNLLYQSDTLSLVSASAKSNPKDERLFALLEVPETTVKFTPDQLIDSIPALEYALMEAIYAMRVQQTKRSGRLFWNRIFVHIRSVLSMSLKQIEQYAWRLTPRLVGLGLEKLVLYSRRKGRGGKSVEELELLFDNISETQFTLKGRPPSNRPLEPMDHYVSKVVRARQMGTVYPYEIVKMITQGRPSESEKFPRGDFEEFDIEVDPDGRTRIVSAMKRPYGQNTGNAIFGIITTYAAHHKLKRVLVLSDPTTDMGALGEKECRRIIAALDIAEERGLPVEWFPVSAGARIDMDSGTENLDWTARVLKRIVEFTQEGGEINIIVAGTAVGAQSYWNAEATMLMHTRGILVMTEDASMLLTGKKALDFSGCVSAEDHLGIGGVERIMGPNGEAQVCVSDLSSAYRVLLRHYDFTYLVPGETFPARLTTHDPFDRDLCLAPYRDNLDQGFEVVGDIFNREHNAEKKKPFDMRQVMQALIDQDLSFLERWSSMKDAETAIVWETRLGGFAVSMIGIESRPLPRAGESPNDGPKAWSAGTLFPMSSKKIARAINAFTRRLPIVILANLSGFDGSPESLRNCQLELGAEIGRAIVNFKGPILLVVVGRYHGGAYVVFSHTLNPSFHAIALEGTYASVIGGAPAAAVVFPKLVAKETNADPRLVEAHKRLKENGLSQKDFDDLFQRVHSEKQAALARRFDEIHCVERARKVGSIHEILSPHHLRPHLIRTLEKALGETAAAKKI